jgi:hypothetical protein
LILLELISCAWIAVSRPIGDTMDLVTCLAYEELSVLIWMRTGGGFLPPNLDAPAKSLGFLSIVLAFCFCFFVRSLLSEIYAK